MIRKLWDIFYTFAKVGLFTFGGGYAMLPVIEDLCVEKKKWLTEDEMLEILVIAESTPGPMGLNSATFAGYKQAGIPGALCATAGIIAPPLIITIIIASRFEELLSIAVVANAFRAIKIAVGVLIIDVAVRMYRKSLKTPLEKALFFCALIAVLAIDFLALNVSTIIVLVAAGLVSLAAYLARKGGLE